MPELPEKPFHGIQRMEKAAVGFPIGNQTSSLEIENQDGVRSCLRMVAMGLIRLTEQLFKGEVSFGQWKDKPSGAVFDRSPVPSVQDVLKG